MHEDEGEGEGELLHLHSHMQHIGTHYYTNSKQTVQLPKELKLEK